ncbi:MAG TPA: cupin domain-containing protein [Candidatus Sulfotelmatobacter sp.]|nr:cupin domain-containing protein [Candidatus Sulfotelmatobacter sp.]
MTEPLTRAKFAAPVDPGAVRRDWSTRGFSCIRFTDPPGRAWNDFVHDTNELVTVVEGRLRFTIGRSTVELGPGDEALIPRGVRHSVLNIHDGTTHWLYGYD